MGNKRKQTAIQMQRLEAIIPLASKAVLDANFLKSGFNLE